MKLPILIAVISIITCDIQIPYTLVFTYPKSKEEKKLTIYEDGFEFTDTKTNENPRIPFKSFSTYAYMSSDGKSITIGITGIPSIEYDKRVSQNEEKSLKDVSEDIIKIVQFLAAKLGSRFNFKINSPEGFLFKGKNTVENMTLSSTDVIFGSTPKTLDTLKIVIENPQSLSVSFTDDKSTDSYMLEKSKSTPGDNDALKAFIKLMSRVCSDLKWIPTERCVGKINLRRFRKFK
jgi:hypothetical protein